MNNVCVGYGYVEAWHYWLSGDSIQGACLWGMRILWWARLGKIAAAIAGTVIILDIVGEQNLRAYASKIVSRSSIFYRDWNVFRIYSDVYVIVVILWILIIGVIYIFRLYLPHGFETKWLDNLTTVILFLSVVITVLLTLGSLLTLSLSAMVALTQALSHENVAFWLRSISLILFAFGFHFDLLGS